MREPRVAYCAALDCGCCLPFSQATIDELRMMSVSIESYGDTDLDFNRRYAMILLRERGV